MTEQNQQPTRYICETPKEYYGRRQGKGNFSNDKILNAKFLDTRKALLCLNPSPFFVTTNLELAIFYTETAYAILTQLFDKNFPSNNLTIVTQPFCPNCDKLGDIGPYKRNGNIRKCSKCRTQLTKSEKIKWNSHKVRVLIEEERTRPQKRIEEFL